MFQNHTIATTIVQPAIWQPLMSLYSSPQSWLHFPTSKKKKNKLTNKAHKHENKK